MSDRLDGLAALFRETGSAHHQAFIETDGEDAEWPLWYAEYLEGRIGEWLGETPTKSELVYHILSAQREQEERAPGSDWPDYYARFFIDRFPSR